jgi:hypothetical protein
MEKPIKDTIKEILKSYQLEEKLMAVRIKDSWEKLMGKSIMGHTTEIYIKGKKLYLKFDSAALKEELSYSREKVVKMVNEELDDDVIDEIILR